MVGILPGLGPLTTIAMLLPITFKMPAVSALIMLSGIYYGAHHAASTTAIMLNMPGEPTSVVICFDGHPMARQGRAGPALCIAALSSFFAGCVAVLIIALFSPVLADIALDFSAPEYTSMMVLALVSSATLSDGPALTSLAMVVLGLLLGTVGTDINTNVQRFTFGLPNLYDGLDFVVVAVGLFAVAEIVWRLQHHHAQAQPLDKVRGLLPRWEDIAATWKPILRGTALGGALGILPGTGPLISSFASYGLERSLARDPARFGNGAIERVAGPEAANNAAALTHFIPMLTLGIPAGAANALMLGALIIQGITPGPSLSPTMPTCSGASSQACGSATPCCWYQPAAGRRVDPPAAHAVPSAVSRHHRVQLHRRLQPGEFGLGRDPGGWVRRRRLHPDGAGLPSRAADPGPGDGTAAGREPAAQPADLTRRSDDPAHPPDQRGVPGADRGDPGGTVRPRRGGTAAALKKGVAGRSAALS